MVAVIGQGGTLPPEIEEDAEALGRAAIDAGFRLATGGRDGVMAAVSKGARESPRWREGDVLGILPGSDPAAANPFVDIVVATGLGIARNAVLVTSADAVVVIAGGAGTLSEIAMAWQLGRPIVALGRGGGWAARLGGQAIDDRRPDVVEIATDPHDAIARVAARLRRG